MARDWRRLALAVLATAALVLTGVGSVTHAQGKADPKKASAKAAADDDSEEELKPKAAPKRKKQDVAEAQKVIEGAGKLVEAGKSEQAVQSISNTLSAGNLPPGLMAKALMYRGMAYRQQQKTPQAIADLTGALWLKGGLSPTDRSAALQQRSAAYKEAGLGENGEPVAAAQRTASASQVTTGTAGGWGAGTTTSSSTTTPATTTSASGSSGSWNMFGNLFGGGSASAQQPEQPKAPAPAAPKAPPAEPQASSWATTASASEVRRAPERAAPVERPVETAAIAKPDGRFRVQVAMVRSESEAYALAQKVKRDHPAVFGSRVPEIDQAVVGNMGAFYRVRLGPYASQAEGQQACAQLKGSGLDCLVVAQ